MFLGTGTFSPIVPFLPISFGYLPVTMSAASSRSSEFEPTEKPKNCQYSAVVFLFHPSTMFLVTDLADLVIWSARSRKVLVRVKVATMLMVKVCTDSDFLYTSKSRYPSGFLEIIKMGLMGEMGVMGDGIYGCFMLLRSSGKAGCRKCPLSLKVCSLAWGRYFTMDSVFTYGTMVSSLE